MKTQIVITLSSVAYGQNKYHLCFDCSSSLDYHKKYYISFCGTDLETNIPLVKSDEDTLKQMLQKDYGFAPFDMAKTKQILALKFRYCIES